MRAEDYETDSLLSLTIEAYMKHFEDWLFGPNALSYLSKWAPDIPKLTPRQLRAKKRQQFIRRAKSWRFVNLEDGWHRSEDCW